MSAQSRHSAIVGWTAQRWTAYVLVVFLLQVAAISWFSSRGRTGVKPNHPVAHVRLAPAYPASDRPQIQRHDPTVFALVTSTGFSGPAWLTVAPFRYQPSHPPEPMHWLTLRMEELGDDFAEFVQTNNLPQEELAQQLAPALARPVTPEPRVAAATIVRLEGELTGRRIVSPTLLPRQSEPILTNTVIQVMVDARGDTLSALLLASCGVDRADQEALRFAKGARFDLQRVRGGRAGGVVFGKMAFEWSQVRWNARPAETAQR